MVQETKNKMPYPKHFDALDYFLKKRTRSHVLNDSGSGLCIFSFRDGKLNKVVTTTDRTL